MSTRGLRIGPLRQRVIIERATTSQDDYGQAIASWATVATRWGSLRALRGTEAVNGEQLAAETVHEIVLRGGVEVRAADRLVIGGRAFGVVEVCDPDGLAHQVRVLVKESRP